MIHLETRRPEFKFIALGFLFILVSISSESQNYFTNEQFINEIYKTYVDTNLAFYYLDSECISNTRLLQDSSQIKSELKGIMDNHEIKHLIREIKSDSQTIYWNTINLQKARCINSDELNDLTSDVIVIAPKFWWRKIFQQIAYEKEARRQYEILNKSKTLEEKKGYRFSRPYFSNSKQFALIYLSYHCGTNCGQSCIILYEKHGNHWKERKRLACSMS